MTKAEILALQPGRELDALVAEKVMGWPPIGEGEPYRLHQHRGGVIANGIPQRFNSGVIPLTWQPSTDIAAAWQVVEAMRPEYGFWIDGDDGYIVEFQHGMPGMTDYRHGRAFAPTAPEAICKAALLAKLESGEV